VRVCAYLAWLKAKPWVIKWLSVCGWEDNSLGPWFFFKF